MKHKCPAELISRVIRINLDTYLIIRGLSLRDHITMDEALTKLITGQLKPKPELPVTSARAMSAIAARSMPVKLSFSRKVEHANGHRRID